MICATYDNFILVLLWRSNVNLINVKLCLQLQLFLFTILIFWHIFDLLKICLEFLSISKQLPNSHPFIIMAILVSNHFILSMSYFSVDCLTSVTLFLSYLNLFHMQFFPWLIAPIKAVPWPSSVTTHKIECI